MPYLVRPRRPEAAHRSDCPGPAVVKWRPARDAIGHVTEFALVRLVSRIREGDMDIPTIPVEGTLLAKVRAGDTIAFDARVVSAR